MTLDPLMRGFIDTLAATPGPKVWEITPDEMRAGFRAMVKAHGPKDTPIGKVNNLTIPGPGGDLALRVYTPVAAGSDALPALVFFHGGAFRIGDLDTHDATCRLLAGEAGCRVIAVDYRLAPEHTFPAASDDAFAALRWVQDNAVQLGIDPNRIAVGGDSAGANLAAVTTHLARQEDAPALAFQMLLFPMTQLGAPFASRKTFAQGFLMETEALDYCEEAYAPRQMWADFRASPLVAQDFSGLPPAYVALAEYDPLHDEGLAYAEKLRSNGVGVTLARYAGLVHGFTLFQAVLPQAREALVAAAKALQTGFEMV